MTEIVYSSSDTRLESWQTVQKTLGKRQREVLEVITIRNGAAGFEIAQVLHRDTYTVLPRITELCGAGLIRDSGRRAWNVETKRRVAVWEPIARQ